MSKKVLFTGASGYIGGSTLAQLLMNPATKNHSYTAFLRDNKKAKTLESISIRTVVGELDDASLLTEEARKADVVIHTAMSADHLGSCQAIVAGLVGRDDKPIYIHVSGTAVLTDDARGEYATEEIYSDRDVEHIHKLPDSAPHREIELTVLKAAEQGVQAHLVLPSTIYGIANHFLVDKGVSNPLSLQMPKLIRTGIARRQAAMCGKGQNIWPHVHISDISDLIVLVFEAALAGNAATGREGYFFGENGEYKQIDACRTVAKALHARGIGSSEPTSLTEEEIHKYYGQVCDLGTNARCKGERSRALGWNPQFTTDDFFKSLVTETAYILHLEKRQ